MTDFDTNKIWNELNEAFDEEYISGFVKMIYGMTEVFYDGMQLRNKAYFDEYIFDNCMVDLLYDLKRMKDFHELEYISHERLMAYSAGWIIKRKPFQMIQGYEKGADAEKYSYLNEKLALVLLLDGAGLPIKDVQTDKKNEKKKYLNKILYHLRFRNTDPQNLELMIYGVESGMVFVKP